MNGDYITGIYTIYVKDGECLQNGTDSTMEKDNLRVSIYTAEGLENYIYDLAQYAWATQDKNDDSYARNDEIGQLMKDFHQTEPENIHSAVLAQGVKHFKETERGREQMCEAVEKYATKRVTEEKVVSVKNLWKI